MSFTEDARDGSARVGTLDTPHGQVSTPAFMPVGTRAAVRSLDSHDLDALGAQMILANTYHLMLRPGEGVIEKMGGLHEFMAWQGPILTDSGGFQIFSLDPSIDEEGATFRSVYDGSSIRLTPEDAITKQESLGADIAMVLDICVRLPSEVPPVESAMRRTLRWAERSLEAHRRGDQALFGIVQGGVDPELRAESASRTASLGFPGYGIGGLSVGESPEERNRALEAVVRELPANAPRYVMGLGDTEGVLDAVARGADLFDCVWPTRLARHGKVFSAAGDYAIRRTEYEADPRPLEKGCSCITCLNHSRAYVRHLFRTGELAAHRLLTIHNLSYTVGLLRDIRLAIAEGRFDVFREDRAARRAAGSAVTQD